MKLRNKPQVMWLVEPATEANVFEARIFTATVNHRGLKWSVLCNHFMLL